ncbi:MAG: hypothetical protein WDO18_00665 [Acidobacteriota bacterium]
MKTAFFVSDGVDVQGAEPKPIIDNARVRVWEGRPPAGSFEFDTVTVESDGSVEYRRAGRVGGDCEIGDRLEAGQGGSAGEPDEVSVGDAAAGSPEDFGQRARDGCGIIAGRRGVPTPMHFHDKDVVVMFLEDGDLKSTTPAGEVTLNPYKAGTIRFNARDRVHTEELVRGTERAIIVELK